MTTIDNTIKSILAENVKQFEDSSVIKSYEKAIQEFDQLVLDGFASRRGNQLIDIEDKFTSKIAYNV